MSYITEEISDRDDEAPEPRQGYTREQCDPVAFALDHVARIAAVKLDKSYIEACEWVDNMIRAGEKVELAKVLHGSDLGPITDEAGQINLRTYGS